MKIRIRLICAVLCVAMLSCILPGFAYAEGAVPFRDVKQTDWFYESVRYAYENNLMNGTTEKTFSPNGTMTRGMIVTVLHRLDGETEAFIGKEFYDVPGEQWYSDAVFWASAFDIVNGYSDGGFGPDDAITREQLAAILFRYADYLNCDTSVRASLAGYKDGNAISSYAYNAMSWANAVGLINGVGNGKIDPKGKATRAQVAAILMRFCEAYANNIESITLVCTTLGIHSTFLKLRNDGSFVGSYISTSFDHYEFNVFYGKFSVSRIIDDYTRELKLDYLCGTSVAEDFYEDGILYSVAEPMGIEYAETFMLYLPGKTSSSIPENAKNILWHFAFEEEPVYSPAYILYNGGDYSFLAMAE